jgi:hypothetical protein
MVQRVVQHAAECLTWGVRVAADTRGRRERSRLRNGQPREQLVGHKGRDLVGGIVDREPDEMRPSLRVSLLEVANRISRRRSQCVDRDHAGRGGMREHNATVRHRFKHLLLRHVEGVHRPNLLPGQDGGRR